MRLKRLHLFNAVLLERANTAGVARAIVEEGRTAVEAAAAILVAPAGVGGGMDAGAATPTPSDSHAGAVVLATWGFPDDAPAHGGEAPVMLSPLTDTLETGRAVWVEDGAELARRYPAFARGPGSRCRSWAALPLDAHARRVGALLLGFDREGAFSQEHRSFMAMLAQQSAQALERSRLGELAMRARVNAEFAERRLSLLADVSARLGESLDYRATLPRVAAVAVPEMADWCFVHLVDDDRRLRLIAARHTDDRDAERMLALHTRLPEAESAAGTAARVAATGEAQYISDLTDAQLRQSTGSTENFEELRSFGLRSLLAVPITADGGTCGVLTLANAESGRTFSETDLTFALELGRRAGQAVQNARLYQAAHHASEAKSDFLAVMSHELRTPLNAIIGYSDLLLLGVPQGVPETAYRQIERIRSASASLLYLVEEVLSFSRIEAGKEEIRISPVDLVAAARDCVAMIEPLAAEKHLELRVEADESPLKVVSDERKVKQILTNLLSNAVKFTEQGGVTVRVGRTATEVTIVVADTGIGVPPEFLERIFEPFWQVEQSSTRRYGGTGLGLGVARKLARLLEGRLEVTSTVGEGSAFSLVLPLHTPGVQRPA